MVCLGFTMTNCSIISTFITRIVTSTLNIYIYIGPYFYEYFLILELRSVYGIIDQIK